MDEEAFLAPGEDVIITKRDDGLINVDVIIREMVTDEIKSVIQAYGFTRVITEMIEHVATQAKAERAANPTDGPNYLELLAGNLQHTLKVYQKRYADERDE